MDLIADRADITNAATAEGSTRCAHSKISLLRVAPWYNSCHIAMINGKLNLKSSGVFRDFMLHFA